VPTRLATWVIAAASIGSGMAFLDSTVLNVALPAVQTDLDVSSSVEGTPVQSIYPHAGHLYLEIPAVGQPDLEPEHLEEVVALI
jgi:hypothetical protein